MPVTIVATAGAADANSYLTEADAIAYFASRLPFDPPWDEAEDPTAALVMATRILDALAQPFKTFVPATAYAPGYYRVRRQWTGVPASTAQRLAWPRIGMLDRNGNEISSSVIPQELKDATAELAAQLVKQDRTLDNDVSIQGITSVRAGSVAVTFKDSIVAQVIPDAVYNLLVQSWLTDELIEPAIKAEFELL